MQFISTRLTHPATHDTLYTFTQALLQGIPDDHGLFIPAPNPGLPKINTATLQAWSALSYEDLAFEIISLFSSSEIPDDKLRQIIKSARFEFNEPTWARLQRLESDWAILELYHGPTFSFKDYAMCIIGRLMEYLMEVNDRTGTVLVATSGDTGSAAIGGFKRCKRARCVVLFPEGRVSDVQRRQMTTVCAENIHCVCVRGDFDDCQRLLKEAFADTNLRDTHKLLAVNSVNFGRIVCQMIYYFWSCFRAQEWWKHTNITFAVPTGNFGNILAAFYAKRMGCPIEHLIIASNVNDILPRFCQSGKYELRKLIPTITPSIDIQVSSNFERLVRDQLTSPVMPLFHSLQKDGHFQVPQECLEDIRKSFHAYSCSDEQTLAACKRIYDAHGRLIDTHTAVAVHAYECYKAENHTEPVIVVSTAHPSKFGAAIKKVISADVVDARLPKPLAKLADLPERYVTIDARLECLKAVLESF